MARKKYHHGKLRAALLDAAEALVRERGDTGWSLREASARVGVSPSASYHHFPSRDALVHALSERALAQLGTHMSIAAAGAVGPEVGALRGIVAAGCAYVRWVVEAPAVARLAFGVGTRHLDVAFSPHPRDVIAAELDRLVDAGILHASVRDGAEFAVWASVHGLGALLADGLLPLGDPEAVDLQTERLLSAILSGVAQESSFPQK